MSMPERSQTETEKEEAGTRIMTPSSSSSLSSLTATPEMVDAATQTRQKLESLTSDSSKRGAKDRPQQKKRAGTIELIVFLFCLACIPAMMLLAVWLNPRPDSETSQMAASRMAMAVRSFVVHELAEHSTDTVYKYTVVGVEIATRTVTETVKEYITTLPSATIAAERCLSDSASTHETFDLLHILTIAVPVVMTGLLGLAITMFLMAWLFQSLSEYTDYKQRNFRDSVCQQNQSARPDGRSRSRHVDAKTGRERLTGQYIAPDDEWEDIEA